MIFLYINLSYLSLFHLQILCDWHFSVTLFLIFSIFKILGIVYIVAIASYCRRGWKDFNRRCIHTGNYYRLKKIYYSDVVLRSPIQPSAMRWEGSGQPTIIAFVQSLARFFTILVDDKQLIIFIIKISIFITMLSRCMNIIITIVMNSITSLPDIWCSWRTLVQWVDQTLLDA